jgi:hypothetical protein
MVAVIAGVVAVVIGLVVAGVLGYGLTGQVRRLRRAVDAARQDVPPRVAALNAAIAQRQSPPGRHLRSDEPSG